MLQGMGEASTAELQAAAAALGLLPAGNAADASGGALTAAMQAPAALLSVAAYVCRSTARLLATIVITKPSQSGTMRG